MCSLSFYVIDAVYVGVTLGSNAHAYLVLFKDVIHLVWVSEP